MSANGNWYPPPALTSPQEAGPPTGGLHTTSTVEQFLQESGESGFIWARNAASHPPSYYYLKHGTATDVRPFVKESLECPADVCTDRRITTVRQKLPGRRDHFRHFVKTQHPGESLNHIQAKAVLLSWLATSYPALSAQDEVRAEDRVADVLVANVITGNRMAIEVQYSPLQNWHERHDSYLRMGFVDQWIFGSHGRQAKRGVADTLRLTPPQKALVREQLPLLWINPQTEEVGTGYVLRDGRPAAPTEEDKVVHIKIEPLANCRMTALGLRNDTTLQIGIAEVEEIELQRINADRMSSSQVRPHAGSPDLGGETQQLSSREIPYLIAALEIADTDSRTRRFARRRLRDLGVAGY